MSERDVVYELAFLRSLDWLAAAKAVAGETIQLQLPEMGLDGAAFVESIAPYPAIAPDDGSGRMVVTGTMKHLATNVLELTITGLNEPLGVTDTHPIWSEDREAFVTAGQLQEGEHLRQANGLVTQLTKITPKRGPPELVYNLEVDAEHVYHVGKGGLLVHNSCMTPDQVALKELVAEATLRKTKGTGPFMALYGPVPFVFALKAARTRGDVIIDTLEGL